MEIKFREINSAREKEKNIDLAISQHEMVSCFVSQILTSQDYFLDVGCGSGYQAQLLQCQYFGLDPIRVPFHSDFNFVIGYGENIPFADGQFDFVMIKDGINYYRNLLPLFFEIKRILKPGGRLIITEFTGSHQYKCLFWIKKFLKFKVGFFLNSWDITYNGYYHFDEIKKVCDSVFGSSCLVSDIKQQRYYLLANCGNVSWL